MTYPKDVITTAVILSYRLQPREEAAPLLAAPLPAAPLVAPALLALPAPESARDPDPEPAPIRRPFFFSREPGALRAGIRHLPSGTMTITHRPLRQVMSTLAERAGVYGTRDQSMLEAVVVDWRHRVCAGFWP